MLDYEAKMQILRTYWDFSPRFRFKYFNEGEQKDIFINTDTLNAGSRKQEELPFLKSHFEYVFPSWALDVNPRYAPITRWFFLMHSAHSTRAIDLSAWLQG